MWEKDGIERVFSRVQIVVCNGQMNDGVKVVAVAPDLVGMFSCVKRERKKMKKNDEVIKEDAVDALRLKEGGGILK